MNFRSFRIIKIVINNHWKHEWISISEFRKEFWPTLPSTCSTFKCWILRRNTDIHVATFPAAQWIPSFCASSLLKMSAPCPPRAPTYYTTTLHVVAGISAPINILGLYLVIFKSLGVSKYKYCIFYIQVGAEIGSFRTWECYQAAAFLTEIQMSVVAPGYYFFPILGGFHTNELVAKLTSQNHLLMTIYLFFLGNEVPAVVWCFVYRHSAAESMRRVGRI